MIKIKEVSDIITPMAYDCEQHVNYYEFREVIDAWEATRLLSFMGYHTPSDQGGHGPSCEYLQRMIDKGEAFVVGTNVIDHTDDEALAGIDIEEGQHVIGIVTWHPIKDDVEAEEPPDQEYDPAVEGVGSPLYDDQQSHVTDNPPERG